MMFWYGGHWFFWQAVLMWIAMLAFWGLVAWAVFAVVRGASSRPCGEDDVSDGARRALDLRLARGDITADEYRQMRDLIAGDGGDAASTEAGDHGRSRPAA